MGTMKGGERSLGAERSGQRFQGEAPLCYLVPWQVVLRSIIPPSQGVKALSASLLPTNRIRVSVAELCSWH